MFNAVLENLTDLELIANFRNLTSDARENLVHQLEYLSGLDRRKLSYHYPSLGSFCVAELGMEEWESDRKIRAARALQRFPDLKCKFETGQMNLTLLELALGVAHREKLSDSDLEEVIWAISGKSCQAAEREIAALYSRSYKLPKDRIRPLTEDLSVVQFVASHGLLEKLEEIRGLLASSNPRLSLAEMFNILATEYCDRHHPEARAKRRPGLKSKDDQPEKLEVDHRVPWSRAGETTLENCRLLCIRHHRRVSYLEFGEGRNFVIKPH